ncbi:hypothetical protein ACFWGD_08115 [Corynebacterium sp. NPDC060344]|uniref:hypothetical protein n=1 Tax=Corynebacterium sp. NPDC060344 TaxID=3347101 RepID=UPI003665822B
MRILVLRCGVGDMPLLPGRSDLGVLDDVAKQVLPHDDAPTPDDIAKGKDVPHLGAPRPATQRPSEPVRVIVVGPDASLAAVVTHLMRRNLLWFEVAHVPTAPSPAATNWGVEGGGEFGLSMADAESRPVRPVPLTRDDTGQAIVGFALLTEPGIAGTASRGGLRGEVWVDSTELFSGTAHGVQVRPLPDAPGLVAAELPPPPGRGGLFRKKLSDDSGLADMSGAPRTLHEPVTGRAVQAGGPGFRYVRDGVEAKKPREKTTIYRHLLDLQLVR